jgi:hypothetical protein
MESRMLTPRLMLILAQSILVIGAISLIPASLRLFNRALDLGMPSWYLYLIIPVGLILGVGKALFVMRKRMQKNIMRLRSATGKLWPWQIYPPQLLAFIATMIISMNILRRVFWDSAMGLGVLGGVDTAVAGALIIASLEYRRSATQD